MPSGQEQLFTIALGEVERKQPGVGHRDEAFFEMGEQRGQTPGRTSDFDAP
jgi:hypothetical protein